MIRLESINKTYIQKGREHPALSGVDIHVPQGSIYGIIGRSGAGKSTLIRLINLLERPTSGRIIVNARDITELRGRALRRLRQSMGMIFQHFSLLDSRTVLDNVCFPLRLTNTPKKQRQTRARELLELVGLQDQIRKYPAQLSGGQKQRVGIARALASDPEILLCDEATSALDPETTQSILELLADINRRLGKTIVMITHSMEDIRTACDEVAVLDEGEVIEQGKVIDIFLHPQHATTRALVQESSGAMDEQTWVAYGQQSRQKIVRLSFRGETTTKPLISGLSRKLDTDISILQGTISKLKDINYAQLVIAIDADVGQYEKIERYLESHQVDYEILQS